jgi:hypothetical protein
MIPIIYLNGDVTKPTNDGRKLLVHIVNSKGGWGAGFVLSISRCWKEPELEYRQWFKSKKGFELGNIQFVKVESDIVIVNMLAQDGYGEDGKPPIRYDALEKCLEKVGIAAIKNKASVIGPKIGSGLAKGKWDIIESLIIKTISSKDVPVFIYNFV